MDFRHPKEIWSDPKDMVSDFGRIFSIGVFVIGGLLQWHRTGWAFDYSTFAAQSSVAFPWWLCGGIILVLGTVVPFIVRPVYFLWMLLGQCLGWVVHHVILMAIFYLIFTPVGLLYRRWCRVITKTPDASVDSYWEKKDHRTSQKSYYRQY